MTLYKSNVIGSLVTTDRIANIHLSVPVKNNFKKWLASNEVVAVTCWLLWTTEYAQNPLHTFPRNFPVDGQVIPSYQLVGNKSL